MSYVKQFKDYELKVTQESGAVWMKIETAHKSGHLYHCASGWIYAPNPIERLFGVTWQSKLEAKEKELFKLVHEKVIKDNDPEVEKEVETFLNS